MRLGVCAQVLFDLPLRDALAAARRLGFEAIELPVHRGNPFVDLDACLAGDWRALASQIREAGLTISALSVHQEGQLLLGPHPDPSAAAERSAFAARRMIDAAALAARLEVPTVCGFTGCADWTRFFPWPDPAGFAREEGPLREKLLPVLDAYAALGVRFAHECHPFQFAYDLETAERAVALVEGHPAFAFNLDPANLAFAEIDPCAFLEVLGDRVVHVHAKDAERVAHRRGRSGTLAQGPWDRPGRGFRFRVPGWGDLDWRRIITGLQMAGYTGVLAVEHEDPTMSRREGLVQAVRHLSPLLLREPPSERFW
ncbi:MAG: sugar phosphate isomerase/epimerase [Deltaproteobacteria bacterium]|nr:sugar phosphate isomerase/epimerase [Deltaproteobacteria bacterium]